MMMMREGCSWSVKTNSFQESGQRRRRWGESTFDTDCQHATVFLTCCILYLYFLFVFVFSVWRLQMSMGWQIGQSWSWNAPAEKFSPCSTAGPSPRCYKFSHDPVTMFRSIRIRFVKLFVLLLRITFLLLIRIIIEQIYNAKFRHYVRVTKNPNKNIGF